MTELKTRLEEWAEELMESYARGMGLTQFAFPEIRAEALEKAKRYAGTISDVVGPVIEAAGVADSYLQGGKEWTYSEYEYVRDRLANALAEMEGKLK